MRIVDGAFDVDTKLAEYDSVIGQYEARLDQFPGLAHEAALKLVGEKKAAIATDRPTNQIAARLSLVDAHATKPHALMGLSASGALLSFLQVLRSNQDLVTDFKT